MSDVAVAQGAASSGDVHIAQHSDRNATSPKTERSSQSYTIVGVARTVLGRRHIVYTSMLDDDVRRGEVAVGTNRDFMWLVPGPTLTQQQNGSLNALGLQQIQPNDEPYRGTDWAIPVFLLLFLTALACLVTSGVFAQGMGRSRQSLNIVLQNGGSKFMVIACAGVQGLIVALLAAGVYTLTGLVVIGASWFQAPPSHYPLGFDVRIIPWLSLIAPAVGMAALVLVTSIVPAITLRYDAIAQQNKSYSGVDAHRNLKPHRLGWLTPRWRPR